MWYNSGMKTTPDLSTFSPEFQAILTPLQEENQVLKIESQEWKQKYHHLLEQFRLSQQRQFSPSSEANVLQGELVFDEAESVEVIDLPQEDNTITVTYTRKKPVRRPLPYRIRLYPG